MSAPESTFTDPIAPLTRRAFLATAAAAGGAMLLGFPLRTPAQQPPAPTPLAYIRIDPNGKITLILPYVEMGQGAYTSQAQIIAEELEVDPSGVVIEAAPTRADVRKPSLWRSDHGRVWILAWLLDDDAVGRCRCPNDVGKCRGQALASQSVELSSR
jgi:hypothetical protein